MADINVYLHRHYPGLDCDVQCGLGWLPIILDALDALPATVRVVQIKEKFGYMRMYLDRYDDNQALQIKYNAESASERYCERCGADSPYLDGQYWSKNFCAKCHKGNQ